MLELFSCRFKMIRLHIFCNVILIGSRAFLFSEPSIILYVSLFSSFSSICLKYCINQSFSLFLSGDHVVGSLTCRVTGVRDIRESWERGLTAYVASVLISQLRLVFHGVRVSQLLLTFIDRLALFASCLVLCSHISPSFPINYALKDAISRKITTTRENVSRDR